MAYDVFLLVMSQLAGKRKARVVIHGEAVFFEASDKKNHLTLYTKVYSGDGYLPPTVRSCVSSSGILRWQKNGIWLKLDPIAHCVYLFQEVEIEENKYIPFRRLMAEFSEVTAEWREILRDFEDRDYSPLRIS